MLPGAELRAPAERSVAASAGFSQPPAPWSDVGERRRQRGRARRRAGSRVAPSLVGSTADGRSRSRRSNAAMYGPHDAPLRLRRGTVSRRPAL